MLCSGFLPLLWLVEPGLFQLSFPVRATSTIPDGAGREEFAAVVVEALDVPRSSIVEMESGDDYLVRPLPSPLTTLRFRSATACLFRDCVTALTFTTARNLLVLFQCSNDGCYPLGGSPLGNVHT